MLGVEGQGGLKVSHAAKKANIKSMKFHILTMDSPKNFTNHLHAFGQRDSLAAGKIDWGPVPGMYVIEVETSAILVFVMLIICVFVVDDYHVC